MPPEALRTESVAQTWEASVKGMIFVELVAMAEHHLGEVAVDEILDRGGLTDDGAYTAVGRYSCRELSVLVSRLSEATGQDSDALQEAFGHWIHGSFLRSHPEFYVTKRTAFDLLQSVDQEIHVEVRKLYPDARPPNFHVECPEDGVMTMTYRSSRNLVAFCRGMIAAVFDHYGECADIDFEEIGDGMTTRFSLRLKREGATLATSRTSGQHATHT